MTTKNNQFFLGFLSGLFLISPIAHGTQPKTSCLPVNFISQFNVKKNKSISCGVAAVMMLLLYRAQQEKKQPQFTLNELHDILNPYPVGITCETVTNMAQQYHLPYRILPSWEAIKQALIIAPVMIRIENACYAKGHWIVFIGYSKTGFIYLDPYVEKTWWSNASPKKEISFAEAADTCSVHTAFQLV